MNSQEYIEVSVKIDPYSDENAEILMAELEEFPFESFSMEQPYLKCYIQKDLYLQQDLKVVLSGLDHYGFTTSFTAALLPATNWNAVWESQFTPIVVDGKCTIKASFHKGLKRTRFNITIDPKMAFGTGHHQTTYMMCRALLANEPEIRDKVVMDMGCGTAILAILAAKMGARHVYGIDIDAVAAISPPCFKSGNMTYCLPTSTGTYFFRIWRHIHAVSEKTGCCLQADSTWKICR